MHPVQPSSLKPDLVACARRQDRSAWDVLLKHYQLPLYTYAAELTRDAEASKDILQEAFVAAVKHIKSLRDDARFGSWLYGIVHQQCLLHFRRKKRSAERFSEAEDAVDTAIDETCLNSRDLLVREEACDEMLTHVERLPAAQRSTLLLYILEDFSLEEIAGITEVPLGTVKSRLHHAKRALRELVEKQP